MTLLTKDYEEDPNDVRVLYYLGVDYSTILQLLVRQVLRNGRFSIGN